MNDAPGVGLGQPFRDLGGVMEQPGQGQRAELENLTEGPPSTSSMAM